MSTLLVILFTLALHLSQVSADGALFPECFLSDWDLRSPVHISADRFFPVRFLPLSVTGYRNAKLHTVIKNNGWTVVLSADKLSKVPMISGGPLPAKDKYQFHEIQFRWGNHNDEGSDHVIDRLRYPMEMQVLHWNRKYESWPIALGRTDGIVAVSFMFVLGVRNKAFDKISSKLATIAGEGGTTPLTLTELGEIIPKQWEKKDYYTYHGSLNPPHCYFSVQWIVSSVTITISQDQLSAFRGVIGGQNFAIPRPFGVRMGFIGKA